MGWYVGCWVTGIFLILMGVFLPQDWYEALPKRAGLPTPPVKGVTLLQISFIIEGLALIWLSLKRWKFTRINDVERIPVATVSHESDAALKRTFLWFLMGITLIALYFRLLHLNSDLWLDEITPILDYGHLSVLEVVGTYLRSNNHLLNTLLVKLAIAFFGEQEWAIRLPAVIFGVATIPALYWVARFALSQWASFYAALLLAVSYHHIFFSQNARGYTAYLFFSLLSSGLFIRGLQEDRARVWVLYVVTMFLNFASLQLSSFVFASHLLVGVVALLIVKYRGSSPMPLLRRLVGVFVVTAFLGFQLYATILPQVYLVAQAVYTHPATGFSPFSGEFLMELIRGISAGFGTGVYFGILPFFLIAGVGFIVLFRRQWALTTALAMPGILTAVFLIANGLTFSPRFFLLVLPLTLLCAVEGIFISSKLITRILGKSEEIFLPRLATVLVLVTCAVSLASLGYYYSVPKQAYRASIQFLEAERKPDEIAIVIHVAEKGYRYYGKRFGLKEDEDYFFVRSVETLDAVLSLNDKKRSFLVTTFPRALSIHYPDLEARIVKDWTVIRTFPGTIGDGQISVWEQRKS